MPQKSFRQRFTFWLDLEKTNEADIAEAIDSLKRKRSFVKTIRDGIRLIIDLRAGRTEVLFELFPWIEAKMQANPAPSGTGGLSEEKLREIIREATQGQLINTDKQAMAAVPVPEPLILDDDLPKVQVVKSEKSSDVNVAQNFLNGINALLNG